MSTRAADEHTWKQSRYGFAAAFFVSLVAMSTALRLVLYVQFHPVAPAALDVWKTFLTGLDRDCFAGLLTLVPLLVWFGIVPERWFAAKWHRYLLGAGLLFFWMVLVFLTVAEYYFFEEFRSRFNTVAVDYLLYPHEVFVNIWDSYPVPAVVGGCLAVGLIWVVFFFRLFRGMWRPASWASKGLSIFGALALIGGLSTSVGLRELHISQERLLDEIANNGALSFFAAFWTRNLDFTEFYKTIPKPEAYQRVRRLLTEPHSTIDSSPDSIRRQIAGDTNRPPLNVVIVLEESLGSEFWGSLGRKGPTLTPEMDRLATEEGMLFTNIYASGNRTVRGFEGVLSSFPPLPGDSIVKRDRSENVETIARILKRDGYSTIFLYGGRGLFDGMRSFAVDNGYDRFIEQKHFEHPTFSTIWGVCDEDLYARAIEEFRGLSQTGKPFCATVLSVSNHKPYTYPKGRISENPDERRRENAVKYADYALGRFFDAARREPFWTNTVFVVVADHGARVYGSQKIPIYSYEIPLVIAGPAVVKEPARIPNLGCSLDVSPTVLGLIGRPYQSLFFGRDLLRGDPKNERVLINHNRDIGMYVQDRLIVFGLRKTVEFYRGDPKHDELQAFANPTAADQELEKDAIALFEVADDLYTNRRYHLDSN
jgi:phosphoglycerol transferase MdoB-like AlkP superfamily enzyme